MHWNQRYAKDKNDPCWAGYEQIGMKEKGGKQVPNCVPIKKKKKKKKKKASLDMRYAEAWPSKSDHRKHLQDLDALIKHHGDGVNWHTAQGELGKATLHQNALDALLIAKRACLKAM